MIVIGSVLLWMVRESERLLDKDMDDLHIELSDALDSYKWRRIIRGNWSDRSSDSDDDS